MASKTSNYLLGFISGMVTGISIGILAFLAKTEKKKKDTGSDKEQDL